jgi:hypothetical protein
VGIGFGDNLNNQQDMLLRLYQSKLDDLREMAIEVGLSKAGNVEAIRVRLIAHHCLSEWDLSDEGIQSHSNSDLGTILATFGIKRSGSVKEKKQRLWLHLNKDPKQLHTGMLDSMTRDELHALCIKFKLARSGSKPQLLGRVAGVLASQEGGWGKVKKSLRRPRGKSSKLPIPQPLPVHKEKEPDFLIEDVLQIEPKIEIPPLIAEVEAKPELEAPMALPSSTLPAILEGELSPERQLALRTEVERFVSRNHGSWSFEQESEFREQLRSSGLNVDEDNLSHTIRGWLATARDRWHASEVDSQAKEIHVEDSGSEQAVIELEARMAEIDASLREFLLIGNAHDGEDVDSFLDSLGSKGIQVSLTSVRNRIVDRMSEIISQVAEERSTLTAGPGSWREREAMRLFEKVRPRLVEGLESILEAAADDHVQARMAFERFGREQGLDLRMAPISGRLHGLFDLHVSLDAQASSTDPRAARKERLIRILQHGAVHMSASSQRTLNRLEKSIGAFEQVVESILRRSEGEYGPTSQALLIRFMESRGYDVNTPELRPRIIACGGIVGVELGYISPKDVPSLPSGVSLTETQIDSVVAELRSVVRQFKDVSRIDEALEAKEELHIGENVIIANDDLERTRSKLGKADALLERMRSSVLDD